MSPGPCMGTVPEEMGHPRYYAFLGAKSSLQPQVWFRDCTICNGAAELWPPSHHHLQNQLLCTAKHSASSLETESRRYSRDSEHWCLILSEIVTGITEGQERGSHTSSAVPATQSQKLKWKSSSKQLQSTLGTAQQGELSLMKCCQQRRRV